jgi:3-mercaptopyruvate sulfurtransferase SseA
VLDLNAHRITNAAALLGGWTAWKNAGLPVQVSKVKSTKK